MTDDTERKMKITNQADCVYEPITRVTLPHITNPVRQESLAGAAVISDEEVAKLRVINNFIYEHGVLTERNKLLLDALKSLNDVETGAYMEHASQWKAWGEAKEKAKRAIGICEGRE